MSVGVKKWYVYNEYSTLVMQGWVKAHSFNTMNLIAHLKSCHHSQYKEFVKLKKETAKKKKLSAGTFQLSKRKKKYDRDHPRAKGITQTPGVYM